MFKLSTYLPLITVVAILYSCGDCINYYKIDEYPLSHESLNLLDFSEGDTIKYTDNLGKQYAYKVSKSINSIDTIIIRESTSQTDCKEAYDYIRSEEIRYQLKSIENAIVFQFEISTRIENHPDLDSIAVFEVLNIYYSNFIYQNFENFSFNIISNEVKNSVSESHRRNIINEARYVGDTSINSITYSDVYMSTNENNSTFYFDLIQGPIYLEFQNENYWQLQF